MKKILVISSEKTGYGHRSSAEAIKQKLEDAHYEVRQVNVFKMMKKLGRVMEESYIPLTTKYPLVYNVCHRLSQLLPDVLHMTMYLKVKDELLEEINEYKPDLIISVHCMFTKSISYLLKKNNLKIPFYIVVIDLINPPIVWQDKNADIIFLPDKTIKDEYLRKDFDENKLIVSGFPIRSNIEVPLTAKKVKDHLNILMVNPSTDLDKNISFVKEVMRLKNIRIRFVCGLDERLYETLSTMKKENRLSDQVEIYSFVEDMNQFLKDSQLIICKAGPNVLIEAIRSATAVVVSGHINGQENHNYEFITRNKFGIRCEDPTKIYSELSDFINSKQLQQCLENTFRYHIENGADVIAEYISKHL